MGAAGLLPGRTMAQADTSAQPHRVDGAVAPLSSRGEFVVRGANILTMDASLGELPSGDVHVRNGAIAAVGATVAAPGADVIDRRGMAPVGDPFDALVALAQPSNVDTVVVDGRVLRRNGQFAALDDRKVAPDAMESAAALRARANWP